MLFVCVPLSAQEFKIPIWPSGVPNQLASAPEEQREPRDIMWITNVTTPDIEVYLPTERSATGQAVLICPGGGYQGLAYNWEGTDIARWLNSKGIAGIVLKYRLPSEEAQPKPYLAPLQDAKQAIRTVRANATDWNINPEKIGVMGFSAGGHLASTLGTLYHHPESDISNELSNISARPDFLVLIYPVISFMDDIGHQGSRNNLIGENPSTEMIQAFSNELNVTEDTPPTFLLHSRDDKSVPVLNSVRFYQSLNKHQVPVEMHLYPHGGHGYALGLDQGHLKLWPELLAQWLSSL